jgi:hypothetical protein
MKIKFLHTSSGSYGLKRRGETADVPQRLANELIATGAAVKAKTYSKPEYSYTKNGNWYTVLKDGKQVDKFQGKSNLERYGLS